MAVQVVVAEEAAAAQAELKTLAQWVVLEYTSHLGENLQVVEERSLVELVVEDRCLYRAVTAMELLVSVVYLVKEEEGLVVVELSVVGEELRVLEGMGMVAVAMKLMEEMVVGKLGTVVVGATVEGRMGELSEVENMVLGLEVAALDRLKNSAVGKVTAMEVGLLVVEKLRVAADSGKGVVLVLDQMGYPGKDK